MAATPPTPLPIESPAGPTAIDWAAALAEHGRWLRTVIRARLGEPEGVDEVLQEVSLAAVAQRAPLADPSRVGGWLYRLAVRHSLLYRRAQGRRRKLVGRYAREAADRDGHDTPDPLSWLLSEERDWLVRRAVDELPARDRELLLLKYTEDWSCRDLADRLGLSESAVEARLHRARVRLRSRLDRLMRPGASD
ncbi:RNA polymerase sigma factor [Tautonia sociabilis]|uniref:Sigma-70 family RNA polymerase sigma factor n=1 Tax=Tautonia sociabilis TaxID=2080755 RepID=A0A432MPK1_9BACT|nr:sigma-70 family RNA polymerase sigma factor [Tautonia sociabilis]RUL89374.1 sigma-70 family RNA polymerase sigma factor [Tautonia sociabilis]